MKFRLLIILMILMSTANAQSVQLNWGHVYSSGLGPDFGPTAIITDDSGNVYVTGGCYFTYTSSDYVTIKFNFAGVPLWTATYDNPTHGSDAANHIAIDAHGNVYVTGTSDGGDYSPDIVTIKYDGAGHEMWVATYNGTADGWDEPSAICVDNFGNSFVAGKSAGNGNRFDMVTLKYSSDGVEEWDIRYNGTLNDYAAAADAAVDDSGNVYVTGRVDNLTSGVDAVTVKYSTTGVQQWIVQYAGLGRSWDEPEDLALDNEGNVYIAGFGAGYGSGGEGFLTIKYGPDGNQLWIDRYGMEDYSWGHAVAIAIGKSGDIFVTGSRGGSSRDYLTIKYLSDGTRSWVGQYNGAEDSIDDPIAIALDDMDNVYVTGRSDGAEGQGRNATIKYTSSGTVSWISRSSDRDAVSLSVSKNGHVTLVVKTENERLVLRYDSSGTKEWNTPYKGDGFLCDQLSAIALDNAGNVYATGIGGGIWSPYSSFVTIKYDKSGTEQWVARHNVPTVSRCTSVGISVDDSHHVIITGNREYQEGVSEILTILYDSLGNEQWVARYNGTTNSQNIAFASVRDEAGHIIITGKTKSQSGLSLILMLMYNSSGGIEWERKYADPGVIAQKVAVNQQGDVLVSILSFSDIHYCHLYKFDHLGNLKWVRQVDDGISPLSGEIRALVMDSLGNIFVTASCSIDDSTTGILTVKYGPAGDVIWTARHTETIGSECIPTAASTDGNGSLYLSGTTRTRRVNFSFHSQSTDWITIKYDSAGREEWVARTSGSAELGDFTDGINVDRSGSVYVAGVFGSDIMGGFWSPLIHIAGKRAITKYNAQGSELWSVVLPHEGRTQNLITGKGSGFALGKNGEMYVGSTLCSPGTEDGWGIFWVAKYTESPTSVNTFNLPKAGEYQLLQNYPNPFNPTTNIEYRIPNAEWVTLKVFDVLGREVSTLVNEKQNAGSHSVMFDVGYLPRQKAGGQASGVYFYRLQAGDFSDTKKLLLLR